MADQLVIAGAGVQQEKKKKAHPTLSGAEPARGGPVTFPLMCGCSQRSYPHEIFIHRKVETEHGGWNGWPWSLRHVPKDQKI